MKVAHLHLQDGFKNKLTLICYLKDGCISYSLYGGWSSSGMPNALSNLQCTLPVDIIKGETKEDFKNRLIKIINEESVERVMGVVDTNVSFAENKFADEKEHIVTIIERMSSGEISTKSFKDTEVGRSNAESLFMDLIKENNSDVSEDDFEEYLEDGHYEDGSYELAIVYGELRS